MYEIRKLPTDGPLGPDTFAEPNKHFLYRVQWEPEWRAFYCDWPGMLNDLAIAMAHDYLGNHVKADADWPITLTLTAGDGKSMKRNCTVDLPKRPGRIHEVKFLDPPARLKKKCKTTV